MRKNRKLRIIVIGSGFSSMISTLYLVSLGYKPTIIDIGTKHKNAKSYPSIFKPIFYKKKKINY